MAVINLTTENYETLVSSQQKVLIDLWASWCGPCKMMHPVFEQLAAEHPDIVFARVNVDEEPDICEKLDVLSIPTFVYFKNGTLCDRKIGAMPKDELEEILR